jgi:hypothetical protein
MPARQPAIIIDLGIGIAAVARASREQPQAFWDYN